MTTQFSIGIIKGFMIQGGDPLGNGTVAQATNSTMNRSLAPTIVAP